VNTVGGNENYCSESMVHTYNDKYANGDVAHGGYSTGIRAHEQFVFHIPDALDDDIAAPMLCGGITVYSPLKNGGCKPGSRVGVVGIGGLGHFAILFASAMGAEVTAISHNDKKKVDAEKMGASKFIVADDAGEWAKEYKGYFDLIISTRNDASMPLSHFLGTLAVRGQLISVGLPHAPWTGIHAFNLALNASSLSGSHLGSKTEVEEMLQLAADKGIKTWIQVLPMSKATEAFKAIETGSVRYRTVLKCDLHEESA
jgi:alcohol dehydrogenase (NADP+)